MANIFVMTRNSDEYGVCSFCSNDITIHLDLPGLFFYLRKVMYKSQHVMVVLN